MDNQDNELLLEIDGDGVSPQTIDSLALLGLAKAWFELVGRVATANKEPIHFSGVAVIDKCAAVKLQASDSVIAKRSVKRSLHLVQGDTAPFGLEGHVQEVQKRLRALPSHMTAHVFAGNDSELLKAAALPEAESPYERIQLRAIPIRASIRPPYLHVVSASEDERPFRVDTTEEEAEALRLGRAIDIVLLCTRDDDGHVKDARLIEVHELEDSDPVQTWRAWFADNAAEWEDVEDIEAELGRGIDQ